MVKKKFSFINNEPDVIDKRKRYLVREHKLLKNLHHQNIVQYLKYEEFTKNGKALAASIFTEYYDGGDLKKYCKPLESNGKLKEFEAWKLLFDLASALAYCHHGLDKNEQGFYFLKHNWTIVLHRDIKPANGMNNKMYDDQIN